VCGDWFSMKAKKQVRLLKCVVPTRMWEYIKKGMQQSESGKINK